MNMRIAFFYGLQKVDLETIKSIYTFEASKSLIIYPEFDIFYYYLEHQYLTWLKNDTMNYNI